MRWRPSIAIVALSVAALLAFAPTAFGAGDPVRTGSFQLKLSHSFKKQLSNHGVAITPKSYAIKSGSIDPTTGTGTLTLKGKLRFKHGHKKVVYKKVTATLGPNGFLKGGGVKLFNLTGGTVVRNGFGADVSGELEVLAPSMLLRYLRPDDNRDGFHDGWLRTGDLGRLRKDGGITIESRIKEVILRGGYSVSAPEVERVLTQHRAIVDAAVVGLPDADLGEELVAHVHLAHGPVERVRGLLRIGHDLGQQVRHVVVLPELDPLGIDQDEPYVVRRRAHEDRRDDAVDAARLPSAGRARDQQQGIDRRLEEKVVEDRDHVEAGRLGAPCQRDVLLCALVGLEPEPELAQVRSSVMSVRSPVRSMRMITRSSGSGQHTRLSCSSQSSGGSCRCFAGINGSTDCMAYRQKCRPSGIRTRLDSVTSK